MKRFTLVSVIALFCAIAAFGQKPFTAEAMTQPTQKMSSTKHIFQGNRDFVKPGMPTTPARNLAKKAKGNPEDMITDAPATAEKKSYERSGGNYYVFSSSTYKYSSAEQDGTVTIAYDEDGTTVYIMNIVAGSGYPGWVKGTIEGNTITVPLGQFLTYSESYGYGLYLTMANITANNDSYTGANDTEAQSITYTIDNDNITINGTSSSRVLTVAWSDDDTVLSYGSAGGEWGTVLSPFAAPDVVTPPAGLVTTDYPISGTEHIGSTTTAYSSTVKLGKDGSDVYIQGLDKWLPEAWVKGTLESNVLTIPVTYLGTLEGDLHYLGGYNGNLAPFTLSYDAEADCYTANGSMLINSTATTISQYAFYNSVFIGVEPNPVTPPEGLVTSDMPISGRANSNSQWVNVEGTVKVGYQGNDVWVQGLIQDVPEGWAKGTIEGNQVTFKYGQYVGKNASGNKVYTMGYDNGNPTDVVFDYFADVPLFILKGYLMANAKPDAISFYVYYVTGLTIGVDEEPEVVTLPEGLTTEEAPFTGTEYNNSSVEFDATVKMASDDNNLYIQGFCEQLPEAWVKGTFNATKDTVTFAIPQKFGTYTLGTADYNLYMIGADQKSNIVPVVMIYDKWQGVYVLDTDIIVSQEKRGIYYWKWYEKGSIIGTPITYTLDFNALEDRVPTSSNDSNYGDITEDFVIVDGDVTCTISPASGTTPNRFWQTANGKQLRMYSGTLTLEVPARNNITSIVFHNGKWNANNSADTGTFTDNTWNGEAQKVVVTIAANTQLNKIEVSTTSTGINDINVNEKNDGTIYNLQGMRLQQPQRGINIINGKKVMVK